LLQRNHRRVLGEMKPRPSAFTQPGLPGAMLYKENEEDMAKKETDPNIGKEGREAAKSAAPFDEFCLAWISSTSVDEVVAWLGENNYSGEDTTVKARAKRIRKKTTRRKNKDGSFTEVKRSKFVDLPVLEGESTTASMNSIIAALNERKLAEVEGDEDNPIGVLAATELKSLREKRKAAKAAAKAKKNK